MITACVGPPPDVGRRAWLVEQLVRALQPRGASVTQATVSRDLAALGVVKARDGYYLPDTIVAPGSPGASELEVTLRQHTSSVRPASSLVVLRTAPGHAGLVGAALDRWPPAGTAGTIAGDDTVFIATTGADAAIELVAHIQDILDGGSA